MNGSFSGVETTSRIAQWRIPQSCSNITVKSSSFRIGKWDWHLTILKTGALSDITLYTEVSNFPKENPPIASFVRPEVRDEQMKSDKGFLWTVEMPFLENFIIDVQFIDLKTKSGDDVPPCSIWGKLIMNGQPNETALASLGRMLSENIHSDITITLSDRKSIAAHRAVLASRSPVFRNMFSHDLKERELSVIHISDMTFESCRALLNYIFGNIQNEEFLTQKLTLLRAADKYDISDLKEECQRSLIEDIDTKNVLEMLQIGSLYQLHNLKTSCFTYLVKFGRIFDIIDDVNVFVRSADRELVGQLFSEVLFRKSL